MSRVPFDYTLIDRRHKAFVQGKRAVLLPLRSVSLIRTWHFLYAFRIESGLQVQGKIVEDNQRAFSIDQRMLVHYMRIDPVENRYANEFLPRPFLDWFFLVLGLVVLYPAAQVVRHVLPKYRTLKSITRQRHALPG